ncbi:MAG: hypothetical protein KAJ91_04870 [Candidatus Aenigmarchaeota archaeon]|nr:hypothetical protein [Candidatus Aenigmarchaeota archaeon]
MSLEKVSDELISTAKKEADEIKNNAKKEAESIMQSVNKSIEEKRGLADRRTQSILDAMAKKELASAKLEEKRLVLDAKKDVIEKVYTALENKIIAIDKKAKEKVYAKLVKNAKQEFEPAYMYARKEDIAIVKKLAKNVKVIEENLLGGIIFENSERTVRLDKSFDSVLAALKSENIKDVSGMLFD